MKCFVFPFFLLLLDSQRRQQSSSSSVFSSSYSLIESRCKGLLLLPLIGRSDVNSFSFSPDGSELLLLLSRVCMPWIASRKRSWV